MVASPANAAKPRIVQFPAIRLLHDLVVREETPARTPLWLLIMRLVLAALVILALAQPAAQLRAGLPGGGPVIMVIDNGWGAGRDWPARQRTMADLVDQAERNNRDLFMATAPNAAGEKPRRATCCAPPMRGVMTQSLEPVPWPTDRAAVLEALRGFRCGVGPYGLAFERAVRWCGTADGGAASADGRGRSADGRCGPVCPIFCCPRQLKVPIWWRG